MSCRHNFARRRFRKGSRKVRQDISRRADSFLRAAGHIRRRLITSGNVVKLHGFATSFGEDSGERVSRSVASNGRARTRTGCPTTVTASQHEKCDRRVKRPEWLALISGLPHGTNTDNHGLTTALLRLIPGRNGHSRAAESNLEGFAIQSVAGYSPTILCESGRGRDAYLIAPRSEPKRKRGTRATFTGRNDDTLTRRAAPAYSAQRTRPAGVHLCPNPSIGLPAP